MTKKKHKMLIRNLMFITACALAAVGTIMLISGISYIHSYYSTYGMKLSDGFMSALTYVISQCGYWYAFGLVFFFGSKIYEKVMLLLDAAASEDDTAQESVAETAAVAEETAPVQEVSETETAEEETESVEETPESETAEDEKTTGEEETVTEGKDSDN